MSPTRGDLVEVQWVDIFEDSTGDPENAQLAPRLSVGYFWGRRESQGIDCIVTTTTMDDANDQNGWCCYPEPCVRRIKIIRKTPKPRKKR